MDLGEVGWCDVDWIGLAQDRNRWRALLLWIRYWTFGFHEMLGNYRVAWRLVASRVVLSSIELVTAHTNPPSSKLRQCEFLEPLLWSRILSNKKLMWLLLSLFVSYRAQEKYSEIEDQL
jgi:hypothetical protein